MQTRELKVDEIVQKMNSRGKHFNNDLSKMMLSIKENGLLQPIGVVKKGSKYEVAFGNRRFEAVKKLGHKTIHANVLDLDSKEFKIINLIENAQRSDITVYEQGRAFYDLRENENMSDAEIAARIGLTQNRIKASIAIFQDTPEEFRNDIVTENEGRIGINLTIAEKVISTGKRYNLKKSELSDILRGVKKGKITTNKIRAVFELIAEGNSVDKAMKIADKVKVITIRLPLLTSDIDRWHRTYEGSLHDHIAEVVYATPELGLRRP